MQDEELLRRLGKLLRSTAEPDVEPIVERARQAAVDEVTAILEALLTRSILERAVDQLAAGEPGAPTVARTRPGPAPDLLCYVYGVQHAAADPPADAPGVVDAPVEGVEAEGLRAIVSTVRRDDFGPDAVGDDVGDLEWIGTNARAHEAVLCSALDGGPVLPLRFGTVFRDREAVAEVLRRHRAELVAELERMAGVREWGAKVLVDLDACDRWIAGQSPGAPGRTTEPAPTDGRAYLARRQAQRGARDERHRLLLDVSREIHERLSELAVDAVTEPPQQRRLSGHEGEMILNGAYLVDDTGIDRFHEAADDLNERHADKGVVVHITGPWPPHQFIDVPPLGDPEEGG